MRSLSDAEAKVVQALIANVSGGETERIRAAGVPRSTYHKIRRKAFLEGWVRERFVPDARLLARHSVSFTLAQPFAEHWREAIRWWRERRGTVLLWAGPGTLLSVVLEQDVPRDGPDPSGPPDWFRRKCEVRADPLSLGVPIYFDFEGAWSHWSGMRSPISYPIPLGAAEGGSAADLGIGPTIPVRNAARALLGPSPDSNPPEGGSVHTSLVYRPPAQQRLVRDRWLSHRVFLNLSRVPSMRGHRVTHVVFVTGVWKSGSPAAELQVRLLQEAKAAPFLFAFDSRRVLLGVLAPRPSEVSRSSTPMLAVLERFLREVEFEREPLESLSALIDHQYESLLTPPGSGSRGPSAASGPEFPSPASESRALATDRPG